MSDRFSVWVKKIIQNEPEDIRAALTYMVNDYIFYARLVDIEMRGEDDMVNYIMKLLNDSFEEEEMDRMEKLTKVMVRIMEEVLQITTKDPDNINIENNVKRLNDLAIQYKGWNDLLRIEAHCLERFLKEFGGHEREMENEQDLEEDENWWSRICRVLGHKKTGERK